jgi:hypothetical protein
MMDRSEADDTFAELDDEQLVVLLEGLLFVAGEPALIERLARQGFHCALGGIALPNPASIALHEKLGFTKVGELQQVGWKHDRWVNVGYWQCFLQPPQAEAE